MSETKENRPYEKEVQAAILAYLMKCKCSNEKQTGRALGELMRCSAVGVMMLVGCENAAQGLEALAKDLRIYDAKKESP